VLWTRDFFLLHMNCCWLVYWLCFFLFLMFFVHLCTCIISLSCKSGQHWWVFVPLWQLVSAFLYACAYCVLRRINMMMMMMSIKFLIGISTSDSSDWRDFCEVIRSQTFWTIDGFSRLIWSRKSPPPKLDVLYRARRVETTTMRVVISYQKQINKYTVLFTLQLTIV